MSFSQIPSEDQDAQPEEVLEEEPSKYVEHIILKQHDDEVVGEEEDLCDSTHLLFKNTESFKCLAQVILSNSSLLRHPLYYFPPLLDPGIDDAFNYVEPEPVYDDIGVEKYLDMCKELEIVPISRIINSLEEDTLNLKYYGLTVKQMKALTETLVLNAYVQNLILEDNFFNPEIAEMISTIIQKNHTITVLNLKECRLGQEERLFSMKGYANMVDFIKSASENIVRIFPTDPERRKLWCSIVGFGSDRALPKYLKICLAHFNPIVIKEVNPQPSDFFVAVVSNSQHKGVAKLTEALATTETLLELDLSFNELGDKGLFKLEDGLIDTLSLRKLNLSHNNLTEESAVTLQKILRVNSTIEDLDLSWNQFCTGLGNKKIFLAISKNDRLKALNLAWNAIAVRPAMVPLMRYLRKSEKIEYLDLSNNRLTAGSIKAARTGILKNHSLKEVKIGNNIYTPQEGYSLASILTSKQADPITLLDMENMYFKKDILQIMYKASQMGKTIKIGGILSNYVIHGPDINKVLFERCRFILQKPKKKKAKKDFGHFILSLPTHNIPREEFDELLIKKKMKKLDKDLINGIVERFPARKQKVDVIGMTKIYMDMYPDTCLPPPKPKKKKGKKGKKGAPPPEAEVIAQDPAATGTEEQAVPGETTGQDQETKCAVPTENLEGQVMPSSDETPASDALPDSETLPAAEGLPDSEGTPAPPTVNEAVESVQSEAPPTNEQVPIEGQDNLIEENKLEATNVEASQTEQSAPPE